MIAYYAMKIISKIFCILPLSVALFIGKVLGKIAVLATPKWRLDMAAGNIAECLGTSPEESQIIAEKSMEKFGRLIVEVLRFPKLNSSNIDEIVAVEGLEYLEQAYNQHKGVIMTTGHFGNWELLGATVALHGYPMLSIARKQNNGAMDRFINEYREMVGQKVAYNRGGNEILAISRMLKEKNLLGIIFDQDTNDVGVKIKLFGKDVITPAGPAILSRMYGSPILPIFMHYHENGEAIAKIYPPIYTEKSKDKDKDIYDATEKLIAILENEIRSNPYMWFWVHDRWKDGKARFKK